MSRSKFAVSLFAVSVVALAYLAGYHAVHSKADDLGQHKIAAQHALSTQLSSAWQGIAAGSGDSVDIAVYDSKTGMTAHYGNTSDTFNTASIMKLSILEDLLLQDQKNGTTLTSSQLAEAEPMIENSDNDAATALWKLDGGTSALDSFFQRIDATRTIAGTQDYWGLTQTTALNQLKVVNQLAYPTLLNGTSVQSANSLLNQVESDQRWGISGGIPSNVSVQLKNGWLQGSDMASSATWDVNSIGHVDGDGIDYTIAVLTANDTTEQSGINIIQDLSSVTWKDLAATV